MKLRLFLYKVLTLPWFILLIVAMWFLTDKQLQSALIAFLAALFVVGVQAILIRCPHCHTRPGVRILAIWTLLLDMHLYIADVLLLRECPKCERQLMSMPVQSNASTR